ncbi:MAG: O-antigen ligase family protein [Acidobacteria bacterium]|nr:O-antigen ligase family protein [Acidobacteriota bacterium]
MARLLPALLVLPLLFLREYRAPLEEASRIYDRIGDSFRLADVFLLSVCVLVLLLRPKVAETLPLPRSVRLSGLGAGFALCVALAYGFSNGGSEFFYDWRAIVLGTAVAVVVRRSIPNLTGTAAWQFWLLGSCGLFATYTLADFFTGGGVPSLDTGGLIPLSDGAALSVLCVSAVLASAWLLLASRWAVVFACLTGLPCVLVVLLAARRSHWVQMVAGTVLIVCWMRRRRRAFWLALLSAVVLAVAVFVMGADRAAGRVLSMNPFSRGTLYSSTNNDHVNDLLDAWEQIAESPVFGIGLGRSYGTLRITAWKSESWGVHNALLHVWTLYGLIGLCAYLLWHWALFRWNWMMVRRWRSARHPDAPLAFAFLAASLGWQASLFLTGALFTPWPYGSTQVMVLIGSLWGMMFGVFHRRQ